MRLRSNSLEKFPTRERMRLEPLEKFAMIPKDLKKSGLASPKDFKAAVMMDKNNVPRYFVFDVYSLWNLLCAFDERFEESVPTRVYVRANPFGWLVDAIEAFLPLNPILAAKLKKGISQAEKRGFVPFEEILRKLGLAASKSR